MKKVLCAAIMLLLLASAALAQDEDKPSVWLITLYPHGPATAVEESMLDTLESYGLINPEDRSNTRMQNVLESADNSAIQYNRLSAELELERLRELVAFALDHEPDALVTISELATLAALQATEDMDDPPAIFFAGVYNPYLAGIADASCIKSDHVSGAISILDYEEIVGLLPLQNPDITSFGTLYNSNDAAGAYGAGKIAEAGESLGLTVIQTAVVSLADVGLAAEGLVSQGAEAIVLPTDYMNLAGLPLIAGVAIEQGIPVYYASLDGFTLGATVAAGFSQLLSLGDAVGLMVAAYLAGDLDPASAGISEMSGEMAVGIDLHTAGLSGLNFSQALLDEADMSVMMDEASGLPAIKLLTAFAEEEVGRAFFGEAEPLEARQERDQAFLASLECTAERIAEQQAELDAMDEG